MSLMEVQSVGLGCWYIELNCANDVESGSGKTERKASTTGEEV
jgi:hypothetical protein